MVDLLIKFPTRGRPHKFRQQFNKYYDILSNQISVSFIISMDIDDKTMNSFNVKKWLSSLCTNKNNVYFNYGRSKTKIQAINADMNLCNDFKVLLLASDDNIIIKNK